MLRAGVSQLHLAMHARDHFPAASDLRDEVVAHVRTAEQALAATDRCQIEPYEDADGRIRHLLVQFRRQPGDATKRILI